MKSPVTGKEMILKKENRVLSFRKEKIEVVYHYYLCEDSGEQFEDDQLSDLNITQVYNKYRERLRLPFPDEISAIREKFGLSARKMSDILGFSPNTYDNYEKGEIPSKANGRLILLASDPVEFRKLAHLSGNLSKALKGIKK
jgi:putative zinc finger/helix-turn-helix YgiT family protein